ncbi:MAG: hypothetical protein Q4F05_12030 [bacterium]|nr:hypothetical protein [bacterium]
MKAVAVKLGRLFLGFLLCSGATVMALNSRLGLGPWDVLHEGLSKTIGITIGQASIMVSVLIIIISLCIKVQIGIGTVLNIFAVGVLIDGINATKLIPVSTNVIMGVIMMVASLLMMGVGCYLYIGCEMGCGPRDGLMIAIVNKTGKSIRLIRFCIECTALILGWYLGGKAGIATGVTVFGMGYFMQAVFDFFHFDVSKLNHRSIASYFKKKGRELDEDSSNIRSAY